MPRAPSRPRLTVREILRSTELNDEERHHGLCALFEKPDLARFAMESDAANRELQTVVAAQQAEAEQRQQDLDRRKLYGQVYVSGIAPANGRPAQMRLRDLHSGRLLQKEVPVDDDQTPEPFQIAEVKDGLPHWTADRFEPNCVPAKFIGFVEDSRFRRAWVVPHTPRHLLGHAGRDEVVSVAVSGAQAPVQVDCPTLTPEAAVPYETVVDVDFHHQVCVGPSSLPAPVVRQEHAAADGPFLDDVAMVERVHEHLMMLLDPPRRRQARALGIELRPLLVYSEQGLGKSTLLTALANTARLPQFLGPGACIFQGCASELYESVVGGTEQRIVEAFNNDLVLIDECGSLFMRRDVRANVYAGAHRRSFTECVLSAISGTVADAHRRDPRPGRQLGPPVIVCTMNAYQDEVTANLDPAVLDRFKLIKFSPFGDQQTYARYAAALLDRHLFAPR